MNFFNLRAFGLACVGTSLLVSAQARVLTQMDGKDNIVIENDWDIKDDNRTIRKDTFRNARGKKPVLKSQGGRRNVVLYDHYPANASGSDRVEHYYIPRNQSRFTRRFMRYSFRLPGNFGNVDKWHLMYQLKQNRSAYPMIAIGIQKGSSNKLEVRFRNHRYSRVDERNGKLSQSGKFYEESKVRTVSKDTWYDVLVKYERGRNNEAVVWLKKSSERTWQNKHMVHRRKGAIGYDNNQVGRPGAWRNQPDKDTMNCRIGLYQAVAPQRHSFYIDNVRVGENWSDVANWNPSN